MHQKQPPANVAVSSFMSLGNSLVMFVWRFRDSDALETHDEEIKRPNNKMREASLNDRM